MTHRGDLASLALQGDANQAPDARTYEVSHADRVLFDIPLLGYAIGWLVGPVGLFLLGLYAAFLLSVIVKRTPEDPRPASSTGHPGAKHSSGHSGAKHKMVATGLSVVLLSGAAAALVLERQTTPTLAAFTNPGSVSGATLTAALPAPADRLLREGQRATGDADVGGGDRSDVHRVRRGVAKPPEPDLHHRQQGLRRALGRRHQDLLGPAVDLRRFRALLLRQDGLSPPDAVS